MQPLKSPIIDTDALAAALVNEAGYERVWLPREIWWDALLSEKAGIASNLHRKLLRGFTWPKSEVVDVRKPGHGTRPVSVMSPEVRIVYRALASSLVAEDQRPDRSAEAYAEFVTDPIRNAYPPFAGLQRVGAADYSHVVVADVAAFYQYIDHAVLRDELDLAMGDISLVDGLVQLLRDIEGRSFGIPQRSEPSDWLSELYAARIERWMARDGFDVWRYSDDFRVGCRSYAEALQAIESLTRAGRDIGLVLNDQKTAAPTFLTYIMKNSTLEVDDISAEIDPSDVEAAVSGDYPSLDPEQAVADAQETIEMLWDPQEDDLPRPDDVWDLRDLNVEQHRSVRRALNTLTKHSAPLAIPKLLSILTYQPAMTHRVVSYAEAVSDEADAIGDFFYKTIRRLSLNEWQRAWIAFGLRTCQVPVTRKRIRTWLQNEVSHRPNSISAAEAVVTLAEAEQIGFDQIDSHLRGVSPDFAPWYLYAIQVLANKGMAPNDRLNALRGLGEVERAILN